MSERKLSRRLRATVVIVGVSAAPLVFAVPSSYANPVTVGTFEAGDHGSGGWAGGALWASHAATGSGQIAGPGSVAHLTATSWQWDQTAGFVDVNFEVALKGGPTVPGCLRVQVATGAQPNTAGFFFGSCAEGQLVASFPGKVTLTS